MKAPWILLLFLVLSPRVQAEVSTWSAFIGTGLGYSWPKVYRIAYKDIEFGMYPNSIGLQKKFQKNWSYASFGIGYAAIGKTGGAGPLVSVGGEWMWKWVGLRLDASTMSGFNGYFSTELSLGLEFKF